MWESEFDNIVSKKDKVQGFYINQLKLEIRDNNNEDEKITTKFEASNPEDVLNTAYLDKKIIKKRW